MLKDKRYFLFDIDGTLAVDETLYDGTKELLDYIEEIGGKSFYITNNSVKSRKEVEECGLFVTEQVEPDVACVVAGFDRTLHYGKIETACELLLRTEVDYIGTNPDYRCPTAFGFVPDCGGICEMLKVTVDRTPY